MIDRDTETGPDQGPGSGAPAPLYEDPVVYQRRWWTLVILCLSLLIVFVGNSSLNVTLPTLSRELHATESQLQWVVAIYSLVFAGLLFTTGALGDRFGRKGALQLGLVGFLAACLLASQSTSMWELIACRAFMGASAALIMPSTLSILVNVFPPGERSKAIAAWAAVTGAAGAVGPVASGWLLGRFWFGSVFLVNIPFIALALVGGWFLVPRSSDPSESQFDPLGALLSIVGISALVFGLIQGPEVGWASVETVIAFAVAIVVLALFVSWEMHVDEPMLDMSYFKNKSFSTGTGGMILVFMSMYGVMFLVTQYFQLVLNYSALSAAVRFLPMSPIMIIVAPLTPKMVARFGANRTVAFGMSLVAFAFLGFRELEVHTSYWYVLGCVFFLVSGIAMSMSPMTASIMSAVPPNRAGAGSAMNDATRELGAALGIAILGSFAASAYSSDVSKLNGVPSAALHESKTSLAAAIDAAKDLPHAAAAALRAGADAAFMDGLHLAVTAGAILSAVAAVAVFRYLPSQNAIVGDHGPIDELDAIELTAELGIAGVEPVLDSRN